MMLPGYGVGWLQQVEGAVARRGLMAAQKWRVWTGCQLFWQEMPPVRLETMQEWQSPGFAGIVCLGGKGEQH